MAASKEKVIEQRIRRKSYTRYLRLVKKVCPQCGQTFEGVKKQVFCSAACRSQADYQKHAESRRQARMERYRTQQRARGR